MSLAYVLLLALAVLMLLVDLVVAAALARAVPLAVGGTETTGHVVRIESRRPGRPRSGRLPDAALHARDHRHVAAAVGEPALVRYDPARPAWQPR